MKIAALHYHLKPGGVTTVLRQQMAAVENHGEMLVLTGHPAPPDFPAPHTQIHGLAYDAPVGQAPDWRRTVDDIETAIRHRWSGGCDLIHIHNPLLAKNRYLLRIVAGLKQKGHALFLQVHDFAEDGRPWSYYGSEPYPEDCHYGVINSRDHEILQSAGLSKDGLHLLPNMVDAFALPEKDVETDKPVPAFVLYPVRALRRKNIGEALLLSLFFPKNCRLAITLPPNSPRDWRIYDAWKAFASNHRLNALFEASGTYDFKALVQSAACLLTTSITEGFGFAFLEPWTAEKMLVGRKLPAICRDFENNGVDLDHLYTALAVPLAWIEMGSFENKWRSCFHRTADVYGFEMSADAVDRFFERLDRAGWIDFAMLDEAMQREIIVRVLQDPAARTELKESNPFLCDVTDPRVSDRLVRSNRGAVINAYSLDAYRRRLFDVYQKVTTVSVRQKIRKDDLLRRFLDPQRFELMKWCGDA